MSIIIKVIKCINTKHGQKRKRQELKGRQARLMHCQLYKNIDSKEEKKRYASK